MLACFFFNLSLFLIHWQVNNSDHILFFVVEVLVCIVIIWYVETAVFIM